MMNTVEFKEGKLVLIDQRKLPQEVEFFECDSYKDVEFAIRDMVVRGAPAIGAAAAYGVYFAAKEAKSGEAFNELCTMLGNARPTAVNLEWAIERMKSVYRAHKQTDTLLNALLEEAHEI